ncbi:MAG: acyltransferase [Fibrobacteraceae bacterium]|nr:acyltransferase [Fibrobacteraceae bacterium]
MENKKMKFDGIDGLKTFSCLAIVAQHLLFNSAYNIGGVYPKIVLFGNAVFMFFIISAFGLCCGYYDKILNKTFDVSVFYSRRYSKIFPFFLFLLVIDVVAGPSIRAVMEAFVESTLAFGFLPNMKLTVIGVGWFLGVIFVFYMVFPFFVFLIQNKKRAWIIFFIALLVSIVCRIHFFSSEYVLNTFVENTNFLYCAPFFLVGGILFLYRGFFFRFQEKKKIKLFLFCVCVIATIVYFITPSDYMVKPYKNMALFPLWIVYAISCKHTVLNSKIVTYLSSISFEIYLSHMFIYRIIERAIGLKMFGNGWMSYIFVYALDILGCIVLIEIWSRTYNWVKRRCFSHE